MPKNANAVLMVEYTKGNDREFVSLANVKPGQDVRQIGSDIKRGTVVGRRNHLVNAGLVSVLSAIGHWGNVEVYACPRIIVFSTGEELVEASVQQLKKGQIRDANRPMLLAMLRGMAGVDNVCDGGILKGSFHDSS